MAVVKQHWTTRAGQATGHPAAFGLVIVYGLLWFYFSKATFEWNAAATLAVWVMTLFIQRSNRRPRRCMPNWTNCCEFDSCARSELARSTSRNPRLFRSTEITKCSECRSKLVTGFIPHGRNISARESARPTENPRCVTRDISCQIWRRLGGPRLATSADAANIARTSPVVRDATI